MQFIVEYLHFKEQKNVHMSKNSKGVHVCVRINYNVP